MQKLDTLHRSDHQPFALRPGKLDLGIDLLEKGLGELRLGELVFFYGSSLCHIISEQLCVRNQLPLEQGGLGSSVVFVDGGNVFDPYFIAETARLVGQDPEEFLKNIWVSRAFTGYQLTALITEKLPQILDREKSRFAVVSNIAALYCDPDINICEAKKTFNRVTRFLWNLARERNLLLVTTSFSSRNRRKRRLEQYLLGRADVSVKFTVEDALVTVTVEKHPRKKPCSIDLMFERSEPQSLLEDFLRV